MIAHTIGIIPISKDYIKRKEKVKWQRKVITDNLAKCDLLLNTSPIKKLSRAVTTAQHKKPL